MTILKPLLAKNRSGALQRRERNPVHFEHYLHQHKPYSMWIGRVYDVQSGHLKTHTQPSAEGPVP